MSRRRKIGLISTAGGIALAVGGMQAVAMRASLAQTAVLLFAIAAAAAFALSFHCLQRPLTLALFLSAAVIAGVSLRSTPQGAGPDWRYVWAFELVGLAISIVGFVLIYVRGEENEVGRSLTV